MANRGGASGNGKLERKKTMAMNWAGLGEVEDDDDDHFFESSNRISTVVPIDLAYSSDDEEEGEFDDCRISFSSNAVVARPAPPEPGMSPDFDIWMSAPRSITERRRRLRDGMGLESKKSMLGSISIQRISKPTAIEIVGEAVVEAKVEEPDLNPAPVDQRSPQMSVLIVRSRSDSDIEATSAEKIRKRKC